MYRCRTGGESTLVTRTVKDGNFETTCSSDHHISCDLQSYQRDVSRSLNVVVLYLGLLLIKHVYTVWKNREQVYRRCT